MANAQAKKYIEMAIREKLKRECPGYGESVIQKVVSASIPGLGVSKDVLVRAIELAAADKHPEA
jgi:hypothetical protein